MSVVLGSAWADTWADLHCAGTQCAAAAGLCRCAAAVSSGKRLVEAWSTFVRSLWTLGGPSETSSCVIHCTGGVILDIRDGGTTLVLLRPSATR